MRSAVLLFRLLLFGGIAVAGDDSPPAAEQERILQLMRQYAAAYRSPDLMFDYTVTFSRRDGASGPWRMVWSTTHERISREGHEYLCCRPGKNRKPVPNQWIRPWSIPGFGTFPWDGTVATVQWSRWEVIRGRKLAVFNFTVAQADSHYITLSFGNPANIPRGDGVAFSGPVTRLRDSATLPYSGSVYVDPATGTVFRVTTVPGKPPKRSASGASSSVVDYAVVTLGATQHILRVLEVLEMVGALGVDRVEYRFHNYRKFEADSSITFYEADSTITYQK